MPPSKPPFRAYLLAFSSVYLVWGSTYLGIRVAVETIPPFAMAASRFFIAGLLLLGVLRLLGKPSPTPHQWRDAAVSSLFLIVGGNGLVTWAEQTVPSGVTALLLGATPLFVIGVDWAWPGGRRPSAVTLAAMLVGLAGVAWLAAPWETEDPARLHGAGVAAILIAGVAWALGSIHGRRVRNPAPPLTGAGAQMLTGSLALAVVAWAHGDWARWDLATISTRSWLAWIYLTLVGCLAGYTAFVWLVKHASPARTATFSYVNPVVAVFLGWLILSEPVTVRTMIAGSVILAAVGVISWHENRRRRTP